MSATDGSSRLVAIVFTDLVDSTGFKTRLGDQAASFMIERHRQHVARLLAETTGREIDHAGDGFFLCFETPSAAATFALRLQQIHHAESDLPQARIGIHLGEVTVRPALPGSSKPVLVEGLAVDLGARIQSLARPGQILMSPPVFDATRQRLGAVEFGAEVAWRAHGPYRFQGLDDPVQIGEVGFAGISPLEAPADSAKARRAVAAGEELTLGWRPAVGLDIPGRPRWRLERQLGSGAIGEVWLGAHEKTRATRVFKFCLEADRLRSLRRELVLLRLLKERLGQRDDIAQLIDWRLEEAPYYLETENIGAGDLVQWALQHGGIENVPLESRLEIIAQVAEALGAAHEAGVLHQDLKPTNILVREDPSGRPKACLTDFGIGLVTSREALAARDVTVAGFTETLLSSSSGSGAGTRLYMAPETIEGKPATPRSDVYSLGIILYQVVVGDLSRALASGWEPDIEDELLRADIAACVDGHPERRLPGPLALSHRLRALGERRAGALVRRRRKRLAIVGASLAVLALATYLGVSNWHRSSRIAWARNVAIPEISRLIEAEDYSAAFALANAAEEYLPSDPALERLLGQTSNRLFINTQPQGARAFYKVYDDVEGPWTYVGETPLSARFPLGPFRARYEKPGYETLEVAGGIPPPSVNAGYEQIRRELGAAIDLERGLPFSYRLSPEGSLPKGMVSVPGGRLAGLPMVAAPTSPVTLEDFAIDRTEVTNREYKEFVDAGGYARPEFWKLEFIRDGTAVAWEEAMTSFRDATGRSGPASWRIGSFDEREADHPVRGVSWYEAAAYAEFRGKRLPTVYHWGRAAFPEFELGAPLTPSMVALSNMGGEGPAPVASFSGISGWGAYDMAGNVREWVWNTDGTDARYDVGGAWNDPGYRFTILTAESPWSRDQTNGFRCARYPVSEIATELERPLPKRFTDFMTVEPLSDEVFETYRSLASYDAIPLNSVVEASTQRPDGGREERVSIDAADGRERLVLRIRLPASVSPPYQAIVYFPGADILLRGDSRKATRHMWEPQFLIESGRAVIEPVYAGTYERNDGRTLARFNAANSRRELMVKWRQDLGRTLDYLETREDFDASRVAFAGWSLGAQLGPAFLPFENRLRVALLWSGGFYPIDDREARYFVDWLRRTAIPVLMLNGRYDHIFPLATNQTPFFELLGTPDEHKRHVVFETGHASFPRSEFIRENLAWLDRYLGRVAPVKAGGG